MPRTAARIAAIVLVWAFALPSVLRAEDAPQPPPQTQVPAASPAPAPAPEAAPAPDVVLDPAAAQAPSAETEQIDFAQGLLARGMYPMAAAEYAKFTTMYPQSVYIEEAYQAIGESYFQGEDFPKALEAFAHFKQLYPKSAKLPAVVLRVGQIYVRQKNFDGALKELTSIDLENTLNGQPLQSFYFYMGKAYRGKDNVAAALNAFQKAFSVADAKAYTTYALMEYAELQAQSAHYKEAIDAFDKAMQSSTEKNLKGYLTYKKAETQFMGGNYTDAIAGFQQVRADYPKLKVTRDALANLLLAYFNLGKYDDLLAEYQKELPSIKEDGAYFNIHFAVVRTYIELKKFDEAVALLDKIVTYPNLREEDKNVAMLKKADILVRQQKYQEGLALADQVHVTSMTDQEDLSFLKAQGYFGLGDFDKAYNLFQEVEQKDPNSNFAKASLLGMAHAAQQAGKYKDAADLFFKYYNKSQDERLKGEALYYTALMEVKLSDFDQAKGLADSYLKTFPQGQYYEQSVLMLADLHAKAKQPEKAIALLQDYVKDPARVKRLDTVYFLLGYNMQAMGQQDKALEMYAKVPVNKDDPQFFASALKNSAVIFISTKKYDQAAAFFDRLVTEVGSNHLELKTYLWVFNQYLKQAQYASILRIAEKVDQYFPGQGTAEVAYFKAESYRGLKDYTNALKFYDIVFAAGVKNMYTSTAHIGRGLCLVQDKKYNDAKSEFQKAIDENAEDNTITLRARFETANAANAQQNYDEALRFYLLVSTIYEDDHYCPESLLQAGKILQHLNRKDEAVKLYNEILAKYKAAPQAAEAQKILEGIK